MLLAFAQQYLRITYFAILIFAALIIYSSVQILRPNIRVRLNDSSEKKSILQIIALVTPNMGKSQVSSFIGSIHRNSLEYCRKAPDSAMHHGCVWIRLYGFHANNAIKNYVTFVQNVEYIDMNDKFFQFEAFANETFHQPALQDLMLMDTINHWSTLLTPGAPNVMILSLMANTIVDDVFNYMLPGITTRHTLPICSSKFSLYDYPSSSKIFDQHLDETTKCIMTGGVCNSLCSNYPHQEGYNFLFNNFDAGSTQDVEMACEVIKRTDMLFRVPTLQARSIPLTNSDPAVVSLGFGVTSKNIENPKLEKMPFVSHFLPSFMKSITRHIEHDDSKSKSVVHIHKTLDEHDTHIGKFKYILYMGYDEGDPFYDTDHTRQELQIELQKHLAKHPYLHGRLELRMIRLKNTAGWVVYVWNALFEKSLQEGTDYFYQVNDDVQFDTFGWPKEFVATLQAHRNIGATGPAYVQIN